MYNKVDKGGMHMSELNYRIKQVRKALGISQDDFGNGIGLGRGAITNIELNKTTPKPLVVQLICKTYNVNETWLRTGEGEMFVQRTRSQEIVDFMGDLVQTNNEFKRRFVAALARLDESEWELIEKMADKLRNDE